MNRLARRRAEQPVCSPPAGDHIRPRLHLVEAAIERIIDLRALMPKDKTVDPGWANSQLRLPPNRSSFLMKYALVGDRLRATYRTPSWLEDHFHSLSVTTDRQVSYLRLPFNVDCQKVPSAEIQLEGIDAIASSPEALMALSSIATALGSERIAGWPNLVSPGPVLQSSAT